MSVSVVINGREETFENIRTIADLLREKGFENSKVVVEVNYEIVKRDKFEQYEIRSGDKLEVLRFVGGG
ncbi:MAG: sulfur carrier protein ThiS [Fibrobacter sp.]|nr:sulfur carrier protein ThiS [Fibrobacter sp.]